MTARRPPSDGRVTCPARLRKSGLTAPIKTWPGQTYWARSGPRYPGISVWENRNSADSDVLYRPGSAGEKRIKGNRSRPVLGAAALVAEGEDRGLDAVLEAEFGQDAADVGLDGLLADGQVPGDLPVAVTAGNQLEDVAFAR